MTLIADLPTVDQKNGLASEALKRGILETGFFLLRDRTVALQAQHELRQHTYDKPLDEKLKNQIPGRGYTALQEEDSKAGFSSGAYGSGDYCEKYSMESIVEDTEKSADPDYCLHPDAVQFFEKNIFPNVEFEAS